MNCESRSDTLGRHSQRYLPDHELIRPHLMNARSTSKRKAASCASDVNVSLYSPRTSDPGIDFALASASSCGNKDVHDGCGDADSERPLAEPESLHRGRPKEEPPSLLGVGYSSIEARRSGRK